MTIRQGDPKHAAVKVGEGSSTMASAGCLVCCVREAALRLVPGETDPDPLITNERGKAVKAFVGSNAIITTLAKAEGLLAHPRIEGFSQMRASAMRALLAKDCVLLHVDHDGARPHGDEAPDHFVLATSIDPKGIHYEDPATGKSGVLSTLNLSGVSSWKDQRVYKVKGLRVLSRQR